MTHFAVAPGEGVGVRRRRRPGPGLCPGASGLGAVIIRDMEETDYGSRGFSIKDAEGNRWSFGTYAGEE